MCDNCPLSTCSPATPKAERRSKHPGNPKLRVHRADIPAVRRYAWQGATDAQAVRRLLLVASAAESRRLEAERLTRELADAIRQRDAERASAAQMAEDRDYHKDRAARCADALHQSESTAANLAEEKNRLVARLARFDTLAGSLVCKADDNGWDVLVTLPEYPEVAGRDKSQTVARLEAAVQAANYLPGLVADAMRERDTARSAAEEAAAKLADERQAHAATAAAHAACAARVERLTTELQTAEANLADAAHRIEAQRKMLEKRDRQLDSQNWTIGGLGIGLFIALLGLMLVVA